MKKRVLTGFLVTLLCGAATLRAERPTPPTPAKEAAKPMIRITLTSVMVDDQAKALDFYTNKLGFVKKHDVPVGADRWLTVVSPAALDGPELLLEPMGIEEARTFQKALRDKGIPATAFAVDDVRATYEQLRGLGVTFTMEPTPAGPVTITVLDDTCGNLIQLFQPPQP